MKNKTLKVGKKVVVIDQWVVEDQGAKTNKGVVLKLYFEYTGYETEKNYYVDLKMDDGTFFTFNQYEVMLAE